MTLTQRVLLVVACIAMSVLIGATIVLLSTPNVSISTAPPGLGQVTSPAAQQPTVAAAAASPAATVLATSGAAAQPPSPSQATSALASDQSAAPTAAANPIATVPSAQATAGPPSTPPATALASAPLAATTAVTGTAVPQPSASELLQRVANTVNNVKSVQLRAVLDYENGSHSTAVGLFTLGGEGAEPALSLTSNYESGSGNQSAERITINEQTWQRQADQPWVAGPAQESVRGELEAYLPHFDSIANLEMSRDADIVTFQWLDTKRDARITLLANQATGIPIQFRQITNSNSTLFIVIYSGWGLPVSINPPASS